MDAPLSTGREDAGAEPREANLGPAGASDKAAHDPWDEIYASLDDAVALISRDLRRRHVPGGEHDDIVQTTIGEAWARRLELRGGKSPADWIRWLGRRAIRRWRTSIAAIQCLDPHDLARGAGPDAPHRQPLAQVEAADERDRIDAMLRRAGHGYHALLVARFIEGKRVSVIADDLGVTPKAAERRLERAIAAFRQLAAGRGGQGRSG